MQFSTSLLTFAIFALAASSPMPKKKAAASTSCTSAVAAATGAAKLAAMKASTAAAGSVLTSSTYNAIQISGGTAGTAESEANALFANIDQTNLAAVSAADLKIIKNTHDVAENAEVDVRPPLLLLHPQLTYSRLSTLPSPPLQEPQLQLSRTAR